MNKVLKIMLMPAVIPLVPGTSAFCYIKSIMSSGD